MPPTWLSLKDPCLRVAWNAEPEPSSRIPSIYQSEFSVRFLFVDHEVAETSGLLSSVGWIIHA
jgi:hypothetical protein